MSTMLMYTSCIQKPLYSNTNTEALERYFWPTHFAKGTSSRVGFEEVRQHCLSGAVDTVVVYDLSRLSRSVRSTLEFVEDVIVRNKISFVSLQQKIDTSTPSGKAFLAISAVFNQLYRDEISFKAKKAIDHKQQNGLYIGGHVPYGYQVASDGFSLVEEPVEVVVIARVKALRDRGYSLRAIAKKLDVEGLRPRSSKGWNPSSIRKIVGRTW